MASAATHTVTDFGDNGSPGQLRTLMNAAASGDTIVIPAGTITLSGPANEDANAGGDLDVLKNLIIQGAGAGTTIIDGGALDGVFDILVSRTLTLSGVTIRNGINSAQAGGGGIRNFGNLILSDAIVSNNEAARTTAGIRNNGGGIRNLASMSLTNVLITGNLARGDGGGIYNEQDSVMTLTDVAVSGNTVEIDGGGIYNLGTATLSRVTVSGNNADTAGGGIFSSGAVPAAATVTLTNVTVSGNHVNASGGGIFNNATANLTNVTVGGNSAAFQGGGIANFALANLKNVIVAGNEGVVVPGTGNCSGTITSLGNNLDSGAGCGFTGPGDRSNTDPLLGPLQDNGGFTFTQALLAGSPAIDAGTNAGCPATDQRGFPRSAVCDIGAYEFAAAADIVAPTVAITSPANGDTVSGPSVTVSANASDNVGVVGVQFQLDGGNLGANVTVAPYSVSWNTATSGNGPHTLTAVARDTAGNTTTSAAVTVTVNNADTTAPTVSIVTPTSGSAVSGAVVASANATDNVAVVGVQFKLDGVSLGSEITSLPYSLSWDTTRSANGPHNLTVSARDAAGNIGASLSAAVTVNNSTEFSFSVPSGSSSSAAISAGATANYTLNVAPATGFTGSMSFTCTGVPQASTCAVSPNPAPVSGHGITGVAISVTTAARTLAGNRDRSRRFDLAFLWAAALLPGLVVVRSQKGVRKKLRHFLTTVACLALLFLIACGGGGGSSSSPPPHAQTGTPAGTYTITVAGTAGTVTRSFDLTLTVN